MLVVCMPLRSSRQKTLGKRNHAVHVQGFLPGLLKIARVSFSVVYVSISIMVLWRVV